MTQVYLCITKVIPMNYNDTIYLLISDLSEHTKNLNINPNASLYFAQEETHKIKSNNPRLTLQGKFKKLELKRMILAFKYYYKIIIKLNQVQKCGVCLLILISMLLKSKRKFC